jgi:uncharacterized membrane-anchored protein
MRYLLVFWLALLLVVSLALALAPSAAMAQTPAPTVTPLATSSYFTMTSGGVFTYAVAADVFAADVESTANSTVVSIVIPAGFGWYISAILILSGALVVKWAWSWVVG